MSFVRKTYLFLIILTAVAFTIRAWGLSQGLPELVHPDTTGIVKTARRFLYEGHLAHHPWGKGALYQHIVASLCYIYLKVRFILGSWLGFLHSSNEIELTRTAAFTIARLTSALLGSLTVIPVYFIGKILFDRKVGLGAAAILAFIFPHVYLSHYANVYITMVFFVTLSFLFICLLYKKGDSIYYILSGLSAGLALATLLNAGIILFSGLVACLLLVRKEGKPFWRLFFDKKILLVLIFIIIGFTLGAPYVARDPNSLWASLLSLKGAAARGRGDLVLNEIGWLINSKIIFLEGMGIYLGVLALGGILLSLFRPFPERILLLSFPLAYFLIMSGIKLRAGRYMVVMMPFLALLAALFLVEMVRRIPRIKKRENLMISSLLFVLLLPSIYRVSLADYFLWQRDTRKIAEEWVKRNIPQGSKIIRESYSPGIYGKDGYEVNLIWSLSNSSLEEYRRSGVEYLIASSIMYGRFASPRYHPRRRNFYKSLDSECLLLKKFETKPAFFNNPTVKIYRIPRGEIIPDLKSANLPSLPPENIAPYQVVFLPQTIYERDLQSFKVKKREDVTRVIISPRKIKEVTIFLFNDSEDNLIRISGGFKKTKIQLSPWEKKSITLKPRISFPYFKYLYKVRIASEKGPSFVKILAGPFEGEINEFDPELFRRVQTVIYESEDSRWFTGKKVFDQEASGKRAAYYGVEGEDKPAHLIYGPYKRFPQGEYEAVFRLKVGDNELDQEAALLDVCARGSVYRAKKILKATDFHEKNTYQDFSLNFHNPGEEKNLEFRVWATGKVDLWVDKVTLYPDLKKYIGVKND